MIDQRPVYNTRTKEIASILLKNNIVKINVESPFTWSSGIKSPIYCDNRMLLSFPEERTKIIHAWINLIKEKELIFDIIVGTATAGIPWGMLLADKLGVPFAYSRPAPKAHGTKKQVEGYMQERARVLVVEDLISTGQSSLSATQACIREYQAEIVAVLSLFSYELPEAKDLYKKNNIPYYALTTLEDLLSLNEIQHTHTEQEQKNIFSWIQSPRTWTPLQSYHFLIHSSSHTDSSEQQKQLIFEIEKKGCTYKDDKEQKIHGHIIVGGDWILLKKFLSLLESSVIIGVLSGSGGLANIVPQLCEQLGYTNIRAQIVFGENPKELVHTMYNLLEEKRKKHLPKTSRTMTYAERATHTTNKTAQALFHIMEQKQTNVAIALDLSKKSDIIRCIEQVGEHVCVIKTHIDIINDFDQQFLIQLQQLAIKHNVLIFEDRKFADIGNTVKQQYADGCYHIVDWANIINAHTVPGPGIIEALKDVGTPKDRGLLLLAEMSSQGTLAKDSYTKETIQMAEMHKDFVIGFISTKKITDDPVYIHMTPGVHMTNSNDTYKQTYQTPEEAIDTNGTDIIIVGRGIYESSNPAYTAEQYKQAGWQAYQKRIAT